MAFHHRKFLISEPKFSQKFTADDCYLCYVCPENCYLSPPPPQLSPPPPPPPPFPSPSQFSDANSSKNHVPTVLILMLCVLGVAFLVLSYLTLARYQRRRNPEPLEASRTNFIDENQGPILDHPIWYIRTVGLPQSVIDAIASFPYRKADGIIDGNDCAVCLNDFRDGEMLRLLPKCSHAFHLACIDTWLRSHKNCPVCRAHILAADAGNARVRGPTPLDSAPSSSGSGRAVTETRRRPERDELGSESTVDDNHNPIPSKNATIESDLDGDLQAVSVRRSVSMDFSNSSIYRVMRSSTSMKRSFSFSAKRSLRKSSRSSESILFSEIDMQNRGR